MLSMLSLECHNCRATAAVWFALTSTPSSIEGEKNRITTLPEGYEVLYHDYRIMRNIVIYEFIMYPEKNNK